MLLSFELLSIYSDIFQFEDFPRKLSLPQSASRTSNWNLSDGEFISRVKNSPVPLNLVKYESSGMTFGSSTILLKELVLYS